VIDRRKLLDNIITKFTMKKKSIKAAVNDALKKPIIDNN